MKSKVSVTDDIADECPNCGDGNLCIDNVEGMICMKCGVWFDTELDGSVVWVRTNRPFELDVL